MGGSLNVGDIPGWARVVVVCALLSGAGSGASWLTADTSDRYYATQAKLDFAERDAEIAELRRQLHSHLEHSARYTQIIEHIESDLEDLAVQVQRIDDSHPPPDLLRRINQAEERIRDLEKRLK